MPQPFKGKATLLLLSLTVVFSSGAKFKLADSAPWSLDESQFILRLVYMELSSGSTRCAIPAKQRMQ